MNILLIIGNTNKFPLKYYSNPVKNLTPLISID